MFPGLYTNIVRQAYETIPTKVSADGSHLSYDLTSFHSDPNDKLHFNVTIDRKHHLLILKPERSFLGASIIIERRRSDIHTRIPLSVESTSCHFQGFIDGHPNSRVTLSACNGLVSSSINNKLIISLLCCEIFCAVSIPLIINNWDVII